MTRLILPLCLGAVLAWLVLLGPGAGWLRMLGLWLLDQQRQFQTGLALELRGLATGQTAAVWGLMGICLAYGFLHAAGPGHGKAVLAAYAATRRASALRLVAVGLAAGLAQASLAVLLALGLAGLAGLTRARIEALDQAALAPLALAITFALGLWLVWRGWARLRAAAAAPAPVRAGPASAMLAAARGGPAPAATAYCADPDCADCGRPHLPDAARLTRAATPMETLAVIAAAAVRPCSGALMLLLLAWQMGLLWMGILGTYAMGLGTAGVTVTLALAASLGRGGLMRAAGSAAGPRFAAGIEAATGAALILGVLAVLSALR